MDIGDTKNVWEQRIKDTFENKYNKVSNNDLLWQIINLILYQNSNDRTLMDIYNLIDDNELFIKLILLLNGRTITFPTREKMKEALLLSVFFHERVIEGKEWKDIQKDLNFKISPIRWGIKIKNLNNWIKQKITETFRRMDNNE
jgi:hypothetical protein